MFPSSSSDSGDRAVSRRRHALVRDALSSPTMDRALRSASARSIVGRDGCSPSWSVRARPLTPLSPSGSRAPPSQVGSCVEPVGRDHRVRGFVKNCERRVIRGAFHRCSFGASDAGHAAFATWSPCRRSTWSHTLTVWSAAILPDVDAILASLHPVRPIVSRRFTRRAGLHPVKSAVCTRRASPRPDRVHERV